MLAEFLNQLFEAGRTSVARNAALPGDRDAVARLLSAHEQVARQMLPSRLPDFDLTTAIWAAERLYHGNRFLVYRDLETPEIVQCLAKKSPGPSTAAEHYSADLCLQFLSDLVRLARAAAENDPLHEQIYELLADWPLSAVGVISDFTINEQSPVWKHSALRLMFLDRVIQRNDRTAMAIDFVRDELQRHAGMHTELLPSQILT